MSQVIAGTRESVSSVGTRVHSIRWGLAALVAACAVTVFGAYGDPHPKASQEHAVPFICAVVAVLAIGIFGFLVPAGLRGAAARPGRTSGWALGLSIVGIVAVPVLFWSGLPLLLGTAGVLLGIAGRQAARDAGLSAVNRDLDTTLPASE
jgi:peptidoglycan/LPS O-acetylase OafA/YrhL